LLDSLEKAKILQKNYIMYCSNCQKSLGCAKLLNELPKYFECDICFEELPVLENTFVIYKVIIDD